MDNYCCVCMNNEQSLIQVTTSDGNNSTFLNKLSVCVPELEWLPHFVLCENCLSELNFVFKFREKCLQSNNKRNEIEDDKQTILIKPPDNYNMCQVCNKHLSNESALILHVLTDHNSFCCTNCFQIFLTESELKSHEKIAHEQVYDPFISEELNDSSDYDAKPDFEVEEILPKKTKRSHVFPCEKCSIIFNSSTKLVTHSITEHKMDKKDVKPFVCLKCNNKFSNSSNYSQHLKYHESNRIFICTYCGKSSKTKTDLRVHEKSHLNKREYRCPDCPKCFNTHRDIRSHRLVVHTDPSLWTFVCDVCDKRFPIKSNYDQHMRRHNNEKRYACHLCEKRFVDNCVLKKHIRSHSNIRAFKCDVCSKEYKDKRIMELHMAKIHKVGTISVPEKVKKHFCHICPKSYFAKNKLTRHLYSHTGEKPYECSICEKKFTDKSYVKQHLKNAHNVTDNSAAEDN